MLRSILELFQIASGLATIGGLNGGTVIIGIAALLTGLYALRRYTSLFEQKPAPKSNPGSYYADSRNKWQKGDGMLLLAIFVMIAALLAMIVVGVSFFTD